MNLRAAFAVARHQTALLVHEVLHCRAGGTWIGVTSCCVSQCDVQQRSYFIFDKPDNATLVTVKLNGTVLHSSSNMDSVK